MYIIANYFQDRGDSWIVDISIKPLENMVEADAVVEIQKQAWQMDDIGCVPNFETRAVADAGFVYIAKYEGDIIGFIYGYHHFPDIHYSHMMAVLPKYHGKNVGYQMKKYHREQALKSKYHVQAVQWTVDPLLPNNAYLNFAKLGGYCDIYKVNYYGDPDSDGVGIYAGVPTDRFKLTWPIHSPRVVRRMEDYTLDRITFDQLDERSKIINSIIDNKFAGNTKFPDTSFSVEVPSNYQEIRENYVEIAMDWRLRFREIVLNALGKDFIVGDYHSIKTENGRKNFYEFIPRSEFDGF